MAEWNSGLYRKFENQRTQPARDLAERIKGTNPHTVLDIGCGPGNSTAVLKAVFPCAQITGIDNSENMIQRAKSEYPDIQFELCDVHAILGRYDVLFSNACLQWVPEHRTLIPELMSKLNDGGILAVQMPMNGDEPLYKII